VGLKPPPHKCWKGARITGIWGPRRHTESQFRLSCHCKTPRNGQKCRFFWKFLCWKPFSFRVLRFRVRGFVLQPPPEKQFLSTPLLGSSSYGAKGNDFYLGDSVRGDYARTRKRIHAVLSLLHVPYSNLIACLLHHCLELFFAAFVIELPLQSIGNKDCVSAAAWVHVSEGELFELPWQAICIIQRSFK